MAQLMEPHGLMSYTQHMTRPVGVGDDYVPKDGPAFDAVSLDGFESGEGAHAARTLPEVAEDSKNFIDFSTMVTMPLTIVPQFP